MNDLQLMLYTSEAVQTAGEKGRIFCRREFGVKLKDYMVVEDHEYCAICAIGCLLLGEKTNVKNGYPNFALISGLLNNDNWLDIGGGFNYNSKQRVVNPTPFFEFGVELAKIVIKKGLLLT